MKPRFIVALSDGAHTPAMLTDTGSVLVRKTRALEKPDRTCSNAFSQEVSMSHCIVEKEAGVLTVTMNRPEAKKTAETIANNGRIAVRTTADFCISTVGSYTPLGKDFTTSGKSFPSSCSIRPKWPRNC